MSRIISLALVLLFARQDGSAQASNVPDDVVRVGPGVTPPRVLRKTEPAYSPDARADHIQGTVVLQIVVDETGHTTGITVLSPIGFGLDERAKAAVEKWEFVPGMKDGKPVKILGIVEVNFRFPALWFDEKAEGRRTKFNESLGSLRRTGATAKDMDRAVQTIQDLSRQHFPPAMYLAGYWMTKGEYVPKDPVAGLALIEKAADKNHGPALYELAIRYIEGRDLPCDPAKGLEMMRQASLLGSGSAQFDLGNRYEKGDGVPVELDRARRSFRLCAARGMAACQYRLGSLLLNKPDRLERDYVQAVA